MSRVGFHRLVDYYVRPNLTKNFVNRLVVVRKGIGTVPKNNYIGNLKFNRNINKSS